MGVTAGAYLFTPASFLKPFTRGIVILLSTNSAVGPVMLSRWAKQHALPLSDGTPNPQLCPPACFVNSTYWPRRAWMRTFSPPPCEMSSAYARRARASARGCDGHANSSAVRPHDGSYACLNQASHRCSSRSPSRRWSANGSTMPSGAHSAAVMSCLAPVHLPRLSPDILSTGAARRCLFHQNLQPLLFLRPNATTSEPHSSNGTPSFARYLRIISLPRLFIRAFMVPGAASNPA